jgi:capsular exopolysaccharide synthesis family protein
MAEYSVTYREESSFAKLQRILWRRWLVAVAASATVFAGAAAYTFTRTHIYESSTSLLVDINANRTGDVQGKSDRFINRDRVNVATEIAILRSLPLIETAVSNLRAAQSVPIPPDFVAQVSNNLAIRQENDAMVLWLMYRDPDRTRVPQVLRALTDAYNEYKLKDLRSQTTYAIQTIQAKVPQLRKKLDRSALAITQFRKKNGITDPDTYAASVYAMKQALGQKEQELEMKAIEAEKKYGELQKQFGNPTDVAVDRAILAQDTTYQNLVKQFQAAEIDYFMARTRYQEAHPSVRVLRDKRDRLYSLLQAQVESTLGGRAASVGVITDGESDIRQTLANQLFETKVAIAVQAAQLESVRRASEQVTAAFAQIPQLQQTYTELQRQFSFDSSLYTKFAERLEELRLAESQESPSWRLLDRPILPEYPAEPNILLNLVLGGVGGVLLALALVLLLERNERRIQEVDEIKELTDIPLLGTIPKLKTSPFYTNSTGRHADESQESISNAVANIVSNYQHAAFVESLRSLAINLRYLDVNRSIKSIAFTSALPAEGKSTLIYNLGCILAELDYRVLVVDADLRRPTIHKLAGLSNGLGLSTAIATNHAWREIVRTLSLQNSLDVLTSGPVPPNPLVLLESAKMTNLMQAWEDEYDYVLFDTPPIVGLADAQSLAAKVDAVVMVAAIQKSTRVAIARTVEILTKRHARIAGILINMCDRHDSGDYYTDYHSYYTESPIDRIDRFDGEESVDRFEGSEIKPSIALPQARDVEPGEDTGIVTEIDR